MDTVRFGRALGFGVRSAAKTLLQAADAAKAENPSRNAPSAGAVADRPQPSSSARSASGVIQQRRGLRHGVARFRDLAMKPFVRLSGVLILEICGVFFGIFAVYGFDTMWRVRNAWHAGAPSHRQFLGGAVIVAVFGYFSISSFVRARRRERSS